MNTAYNFLILFDRFINESKSGKRLKKDGSHLRSSTLERYELTRNALLRFSAKQNFELRIKNFIPGDIQLLKEEKLYWKNFYVSFSNFLYGEGCYDNYVGAQFKIIRTFFNYLKTEKGILTADIHKIFYIRTENIPVIVLSPAQLQFLIFDKAFESSLPEYLQRTKDIFVFGCTVGLRYSDLMKLNNKNIERISNAWHLRVRSLKTSTDTNIKLPDYAIEIVKKYKKLRFLLPKLSINRLNMNLKVLCEKAGWTHEIGKVRERRGVGKNINKDGKNIRFCDLISSHTMRRTAITVMLSLGMPEIMVRKISGHAAFSKDFYRYVNYAQQFIDLETDKVFAHLGSPAKTE